MKSLSTIHKDCGDIFKNKLLENPNGRSFACDIWDKMTCDEFNCDNCLGENFNQLVQSVISGWFDSYEPSSCKTDFYVYSYIFWLYLFYERIEFVFTEIDPDGKFHLIQEFRRRLKTMDEIRLWANFVKHPKHFLYVHWPTFIFVGESFHRDESTLLVNTAFLKEHYSNESQVKPKKLENNSTVVVQFPKLDSLTEGFCKEFLEFIHFICDNAMIVDFLKKKSNRPLPFSPSILDN